MCVRACVRACVRVCVCVLCVFLCVFLYVFLCLVCMLAYAVDVFSCTVSMCTVYAAVILMCRTYPDVLFVNVCLYAQPDPVCLQSLCPCMPFVVVS